MNILSGKPEGNEFAEAAAVDFIKCGIKMLRDTNDWMKKAKGPAQPMLAIIDVLLFIGKKYPYDINLMLKKEEMAEWQLTFDKWLKKNDKLIPEEFKAELKMSADELFAELDTYGH